MKVRRQPADRLPRRCGRRAKASAVGRHRARRPSTHPGGVRPAIGKPSSGPLDSSRVASAQPDGGSASGRT